MTSQLVAEIAECMCALMLKLTQFPIEITEFGVLERLRYATLFVSWQPPARLMSLAANQGETVR